MTARSPSATLREQERLPHAPQHVSAGAARDRGLARDLVDVARDLFADLQADGELLRCVACVCVHARTKAVGAGEGEAAEEPERRGNGRAGGNTTKELSGGMKGEEAEHMC